MRDDDVRISVSQVYDDEFCPRSWYWNQFYAGGIEPVGEGVEFALGTAVHAGVLQNLDTSPTQGMEQARREMEQWVTRELISEPLATEYPALAAAMVFNYLSGPWAAEHIEWEVFEFEGETEAQDEVEPWITWTARPDLILRHRRARDRFRYKELKTTGMQPDKFCRIWDRRLQIHLAAKTVRASLGIELEGVVVVGLHKGTRYKGSLRGPLVTGYHNPRNGKTRLDSQKGYDRMLAQEYPGGIPMWCKDVLTWDVRQELVPTTPPILPDERELEDVLVYQRHRARQRVQLYQAETPEQLAELMRIVVPKFRGSCINAVTGKQCQFNEACWNRTVNKDPIASGLYQKRQDRLVDVEGDAE
jgi:hypothetical protein